MPFGFFNMLGGLFQAQQDRRIASDNLAFQRENLDYIREMDALTRSREDTAVQRRVADLKAAGLSPTLAAGSAAQSQQPTPTTAPQRDRVDYSRIFNIGQAAMSFLSQKADIARVNAEAARLRELAKNDKQDRDLKYRDYLLRQRGIALDERRVSILADQLGLDRRRLEHDAVRVANDSDRVQLEAKRVFNDGERLQLERHAYDLQKLMNSAQRGLIAEQTVSERLRQFGITVDTERKILDYKELVYDFAFLTNLGLPIGRNLPWVQQANIFRPRVSEEATSAAERYVDNLKSLGSYGKFINEASNAY